MPKGKNKGIHVKYRKDRKCWEVVEYISGKLKRHATGFSCREAAQERLAEIIVERSRPQTKEATITLGELMAYYAQHHLRTLPRATSSYKGIERLASFWGDLKLHDISQAQSLKYFDQRKKEFIKWQKDNGYKTQRVLSEQTVRREIEVLQAAINFAHKNNVISICPYVYKGSKGQSRERWLTKPEAAKLLRACKNWPRVREYLPMLILLGLYTGARSEALLNLRWTDINFETNRIDFSRIYETKNKKGAKIPIPRKLRGHLLRHRKYGSQLGFVINKNGRPIKSVKTVLRSICNFIELENVTLHTLRHTCVSWKIQNDQSCEKVGKFVGMSPQMVKDVYGHLAPGHLDEVANA